MRIVLITDDFSPNYGGIVHTLNNLHDSLLKKGHELIIINPYSQGRNFLKLISRKELYLKDIITPISRLTSIFYYILLSLWKVSVFRELPLSHRYKIILYLFIKRKKFFWIFDNISRIYPHLKRINFKLLMCANAKSVFQITFILSILLNKKLVVMAHGKDFLDYNFMSLKSYYFQNSDRIILSCNQMRNLIKKVHNLNENKLTIINRGIDIDNYEVHKTKEELRKDFGISEDSFVILSVGRHVIRKDFGLVIEAISEIKQIKRNLSIKYFIVGEGKETKNLIKLVKTLELENEVEFFEECNYKKRNEIYKLSDIFVMPIKKIKNDIEGFGIVYIEANYFKLPVIGTIIGGVKDAIINGETGFLIRPNLLSDLVNKILFLYENVVLRKRMGEKGYKRVLKEFTWNNIVEDFLVVFNSLLKKN